MPVSRATAATAGSGINDHEAAVDPHPQYETADEVAARVEALINAAPAALDTLNEIAAALGDDADFAGTVTTQLADKAPLIHSHDYADPGHTHPYAATSHSHVDADLPAGIARDAEVAAAYSPVAHNHDATYAPTHSHPYAGTSHSHADIDIPATIARDTEVTSAITTHEGAANPHPSYATDTDLTNHAGAADPHTGYVLESAHGNSGDVHTQYQLESEKGAASGYASLDANTRVPNAQLGSGTADGTVFLRGDRTWAAAGGGGPHTHVEGDLPSTLATDTEVATAISNHAGAADPHPDYLTPAEHSATDHTGITGVGGGGGGGVTAGVMRKIANQTMTATAQTAIADMSFPVAALSTYYFQMDLVVTTSSGSSATSAWGFTGPALPVAVSVIAEIDTSTSVEASPAPLVAFGNFASGAQVANTGAKFRGIVQTGAAAGTVQLTVARGGTNPSMVIPAGVNGIWMKVA